VNVHHSTIIFVETPDQVNWILENVDKQKTKYGLVAFGVEAAYELQNHGIEYLKPEDFYDPQTLCRQSDQVYFQQVRWVEHIDQWLQQEIPPFETLNFSPAHANFCFLKRFFDQLIIITFQLSHILEGLCPRMVYYFKPGKDQLNERLIFQQNLVGHTLPLLTHARGIELEEISLESLDRTPGGQSFARGFPSAKLKQKTVERLPQIIKGELGIIKQQGLGNYFRIIPNRMCGKSSILVVKGGYDVSSVVNELARLGFQLKLNWVFARRHDPNMRETLAQQWEKLAEYQDLSYFLPQRNENLWNLAKERLSFWWHQVIQETWEIFLQAREELQKGGIQGIVTTSPGGQWRHREIAVLLAAKSLSIPIIMYQHGGFVGSCQHLMWDMTDLWLADYLLCYGDGVRSYFIERATHYHESMAAPLAIGSSRLDSLRSKESNSETLAKKRRGNKSARPSILYIPTAFRTIDRYLCQDSYEDLTYLHLQQKIIELFQKNKKVQLVYKTFRGTQSANVIPEIIRRQVPDAIIVEKSKLYDIMWEVDKIIVDFPSTALLEVILTDKPILAYVEKDSIYMFDSAKQLLRKRVCLAETAEEFISKMDNFLQGADSGEANCTNEEFLMAYGTYSSDGQSVARSAASLSKILRHPN